MYIERHEQIIDILKQRTSASVHFLAKQLHTSEPTIRRDLRTLALENKIKRTFGGAVINNDVNAEVPLVLREMENKQSKETVAFKASEFKYPNDNQDKPKNHQIALVELRTEEFIKNSNKKILRDKVIEGK